MEPFMLGGSKRVHPGWLFCRDADFIANFRGKPDQRIIPEITCLAYSQCIFLTKLFIEILSNHIKTRLMIHYRCFTH